MSPLLSLCFPTYNRACLLDGALRAALSQLTPAMHDQVEVVVLDNASPDQTPAVVQGAQADFPHARLRHVRRPHNIGPDANFCDAPHQAQGKFLYLLSDDDVLLPGAVPTLLTLIGQHPHLDAFALNVREFRRDPQEESPGVFAISEDRLLPTRDEALLFLRSHITFLSCIAFRRENVLGRDYAPRFATNLAQAYMFLDALAPGRGLYATQQPFLAKRADNNEGFDFFRVFVTHFHDLMQYARQTGYSPQAVRQAQQHHLGFLIDTTVQFKARGSLGSLSLSDRQSLEAAARLFRAYGWNKSMVTILLPRLLMPRAAFTLVRDAGRAARTLRGRTPARGARAMRRP
jgi:hypothetical protein